MKQKKLSELVYDDIKGMTMHFDASDVQCQIGFEKTFEEVRKKISDAYGDVDIIIDETMPWYDRVRINDPKWITDNEEYIRKKQEWCDKHGCD